VSIEGVVWPLRWRDALLYRRVSGPSPHPSSPVRSPPFPAFLFLPPLTPLTPLPPRTLLPCGVPREYVLAGGRYTMVNTILRYDTMGSAMTGNLVSLPPRPPARP
jgi:hypothetical protein